MTKLQVLGWRITEWGSVVHYWKSRKGATIAVSRCGITSNKSKLVVYSGLSECQKCVILLDMYGEQKLWGSQPYK